MVGRRSFELIAFEDFMFVLEDPKSVKEVRVSPLVYSLIKKELDRLELFKERSSVERILRNKYGTEIRFALDAADILIVEDESVETWEAVRSPRVEVVMVPAIRKAKLAHPVEMLEYKGTYTRQARLMPKYYSLDEGDVDEALEHAKKAIEREIGAEIREELKRYAMPLEEALISPVSFEDTDGEQKPPSYLTYQERMLIGTVKIYRRHRVEYMMIEADNQV